MNAILIDDEKSSLRSLEYELTAYCPEINIIGTFQDPKSGLKEIQRLHPDLVFLDIEMPGMNGFELLQEVGDIDFEVIFVTAYDQFAVKAFEFNAIDYVLKPVRKIKLIQAVKKASENQKKGIEPEQLSALLNNIQLQTKGGGIQIIALPTSEGFTMVNINDIIFLEADSNYTWVYINPKQKFLVSKTLKEFSSMLDFPQFIRPHKSYFVNLNHATKYVKGQGGYLIMNSGNQIPVARTQKAALMRVLNIYKV